MKKPTQEALITKTIQMIAKKGAEGVSIADISKASKISASSIYHFFKSKHGLIYACILDIAYDISGRLHEVIDWEKTFKENYYSAMKVVIKYIKANPDRARFYAQLPFFPKDSWTMQEKMVIAETCPMSKLMNKGIEKHAIRKVPYILTIAYFPVYTNTLSNIKGSEEDEDIVIDMMWNAIALPADIAENTAP